MHFLRTCYFDSAVCAVALSLHLSQVWRCQWIKLVFGVEAALSLFCVVLQGNSAIFKNKGI